MKRWIILILLFALVGAVLGQLMAYDQGYIMIAFHTQVMEMSLWLGLFFLFVIFVVGYLVVYGVLALFSTDLKLKDWTVNRKKNRARRFTTQGLLNLANGRWNRAERQLELGASQSDIPIINYLAAARAAHEQGDSEKTDELLSKATESTKGAELAVGITQAQLQLDRNQEEQALATVLRLRKAYPKHKYLLKMLSKVYLALKDWNALTELLPQLRKKNVLNQNEIARIERLAYGELLNDAANSRTAINPLEQLTEIWKKVPNHLLKDEWLLSSYIKHLIQLKDFHQAESLLRILLKNYWTDELVRLYGIVEGADPEKQLLYAEGKIQQRPNDPTLFLTLGRLSLRTKQWAKALEYFEASASLQKNDETYSELCRLYAAMGDEHKAMVFFKKGIMNQLPSLPMPDYIS